MAGDTPFASCLASFSGFEDGPADSPLDMLASLGSASELSRAPAAHSRRSLDEMGLGANMTTLEGGLVRSHTVANPFDVGEMLNHINSFKLAGQQPLARASSAGSAGGPVALTDAATHNLKWIQPSGARQPGQGCEEIEQGIVHAEQTATGGAILRITLLAAGFIIGPSGCSVRDICRACGSDIKSWTCEPDARCSRPTRQFRVEGPPGAVARSLEVVCDAVQRYKELCEGKYAGQSVPRVQHVSGIDFSYQPPPRNIVPFAAALKSQSSAKRQGSGSLSHKGSGGHHHHHGRPPTGPSYKDAISRTSSSSLPVAASGTTPHPAPTPSMARSSSLPAPSRPRSAAAAVHAQGEAQAQAARAAGRPPTGRPGPGSTRAPSREGQGPGQEQQERAQPAAGAGAAGGKAEEGGRAPALAPAGPDADVELPTSPFGAAAEQARPASRGGGSDSEGGSAGEAGSKQAGEGEPAVAPSHPALPAPTRTLDKSAVLRTVFATAGQPPQPAGAGLQPGGAPALPHWLHQLALQQGQQQGLVATAAAAQALFPNQGSLLSELSGMGHPGLHGMAGAGAGAGHSAFAGGPPPQQEPHGQLQAALAALGLSPQGGGLANLLGGAQAGQHGFLGALGSPGGPGGEWAPGAAMLGGHQAAYGSLESHSLLQLAASGLLGPGTPTPSPIPLTPFPSPSPEGPQQRQLLEALQALSGGCPAFGTVGSPSEPAIGQGPAEPGSLDSPPRTSRDGGTLFPMDSPGPITTGAASSAQAALRGPPSLQAGPGLSAASALSPPGPATSAPPPPLGAGGASQLLSAGAPFSAFNSTGSFLGQPAGGFPGKGSPFMLPHVPFNPPSAFDLCRASSLALAEGPTHSLGSAGPSRSFSLPMHASGNQAGDGGQASWADPWADLLSGALEGEERNSAAKGSNAGVEKQ